MTNEEHYNYLKYTNKIITQKSALSFQVSIKLKRIHVEVEEKIEHFDYEKISKTTAIKAETQPG